MPGASRFLFPLPVPWLAGLLAPGSAPDAITTPQHMPTMPSLLPPPPRPLLPVVQRLAPLLFPLLVPATAHGQAVVLAGDTRPTAFVGAPFNAEQLVVGNTGSGSLQMHSDAGVLHTGEAVVGAQAGSSGLATLATGAQWHSPLITVGDVGSATLHIHSGAQLFSREAIIGHRAGSQGIVTVAGRASAWHGHARAGLLVVGDAGQGTLRVLDGAAVSSSHHLRTAEQPGATARVDVDGAGSTLAAGYCFFSTQGVSAVRVSRGGRIHCRSEAWLRFGDFSVQGAGAAWAVGTHLTVGADSGPAAAVLRIGQGGVVEAGTALRLAHNPGHRPAGRGAIHLEGTTAPGRLLTPQVLFGADGLGAVHFDHHDSSGSYVFSPSLSGPGRGEVSVNQPGMTTLTGDNDYTGVTRVQAGVLRAGAATGLSPASDYTIASGATLDTQGYSTRLNSLAHAGTVTTGASGTSATLTVRHHYRGDGGSLALGTALGGSDAATERLRVQGDTSGTTTLHIRNLGGSGAPTTGAGILVVQVDGASKGRFRLPNPGYLQAGGFRYRLIQQGKNWYLQSEAVAPRPALHHGAH